MACCLIFGHTGSDFVEFVQRGVGVGCFVRWSPPSLRPPEEQGAQRVDAITMAPAAWQGKAAAVGVGEEIIFHCGCSFCLCVDL